MVKPFISAPPDLQLLPVDLPEGQDTPTLRIKEWETEVNRIISQPQRNVDKFIRSLERPMPVWNDDPVFEADSISFS